MSVKRKADDMLTEASIIEYQPVARRARSYSTTPATTPSTTIESIMSPSSISTRPTSSHSVEMQTDDDETADASSASVSTVYPGDIAMDDGLIPVKNFGKVMDGVYRSSFPQEENLPFLKTLGLKTILTLVDGPYPESHTTFVKENGIKHVQVTIEANKSPFVTITHCSISFALGVLLDKANYPILVHCNKGKHRTGCVIGCFRKIIGWDLPEILEEYHHYAGAKARVLDERYLEMFEERSMLWLARHNGVLPPDEPARTESPIGALSFTSRLRS